MSAEGGQAACTLLVASCDAYADLWPPYFNLLRKWWPDCPFPVALITEERQPQIEGVHALCLGRGFDWSTLMLRALDAVGTPYVLLTLEDFFLRGRVDTTRVLGLLEQMQQRRLSMVRLVPRPGPTDRFEAASGMGWIAPGARYRVSTQAALWDVETLRTLLVTGESAWEFEVNGTMRSATHDGFAAVRRAALPYRHHVVERGKWFPWAAWRFTRLNVGVDLTARPIMSAGETLRWVVGKLISPVVHAMPARVRRALRALARRVSLVR